MNGSDDYAVRVKNTIEPLKKTGDLFEGFPFISQADVRGFKGHYPPEFYIKNKTSLHSSSLDEVDIWSLQLSPKLLDVIYIKAIWIDDYKEMGNDLFGNICYTYNLSNGHQEILKEWIRQGGVFWIENGIYSTGSELGPEKKISSTQNFLGREVSLSHYTLDESVNKESIVYDRLHTTSSFETIRSLRLDLTRASQTFFIIKGKDQIVSSDKQSILSIADYGEGKIVSMLPFDAYDAYRDGELLRWELLKTLDKAHVLEEISRLDSVEDKKNLEKEIHTLSMDDTVVTDDILLRRGHCIQLFSYSNKIGADQEILKARKFSLARVEKHGKYYSGRVGMYPSGKDAQDDLRHLGASYPGAYVRKCTFSGLIDTKKALAGNVH